MKALAPCATAAAWEVVAGAEALEEPDEVGVLPVMAADEAAPEEVPEAVKVTPCMM